ncbi:hypothetical protein [Acidipropionibacterium jensenii]|uniref:hypothetical protein n=1 Tax=Acidipropionibacterium jensenii TaxID=1749 RepID=UPI000F836B0E|nr:hypothetical protein [Acidipropionibacterium jensenii]
MMASRPYELDLQWVNRAGLTPLTDAEQALANSLRTGECVDLRKTCQLSELVTERAPIRSSLIRALVCGQVIPESQIDSHGLIVIGAILDTRLDLNDVTYSRPLIFSECILTQGLAEPVNLGGSVTVLDR